MHYASLASGSKGNAHVLGGEGRLLLVDAGISFLQIRRRLEALGWGLEAVAGLALTHEHSDHIAALPMVLRHTAWPVLGTEGTLRAAEAAKGVEIPKARRVVLRPGHAVAFEDWRLLPFATPHDAADPVAYRVEGPGWAAAVVTDLGHPTALVAEHCRDLDLLALESNHDVDMLREGAYPPDLKARILSRVGHLSNEASAGLLARILGPRLRAVVLAHLSEQNNAPELARLAAAQVLDGSGAVLHVASQGMPLRA